jgi:hypothetical protein
MINSGEKDSERMTFPRTKTLASNQDRDQRQTFTGKYTLSGKPDLQVESIFA